MSAGCLVCHACTSCVYNSQSTSNDIAYYVGETTAMILKSEIKWK